MAAFKQHATFGFWKGSLVVGKDNEQMSGMGQFGRLTSPDLMAAAARPTFCMRPSALRLIMITPMEPVTVVG